MESSLAAILSTFAKLGPVAIQSGMVTREEVRATLRELRRAMANGTHPLAPSRGLSVRTTSERLETCTKSVYRMIAAGTLPAVRVTGSRKSIRIPESAVNAILAGTRPVEVDALATPPEVEA